MIVTCVAVGDSAVGKSCMLISYTTNAFPPNYIRTVFEDYTTDVMLNGRPIKLILKDTSGQSELDRLRPLSYAKADVFLLVYSVVSPVSLQNLQKKWVLEVRQHAPNVPFVVVGTKTDLRTNQTVLRQLQQRGMRPITTQEGQKFAQQAGARSFMECSSLTQRGLKATIDEAIRVANKKESGGCCTIS